MKEETADLVFRVIDHGLRLKERVETDSTSYDLDNEQAEIKGILMAPEAARIADYGGDRGVMDTSLSAVSARAGDDGRRNGFLGIKYALACWLDEIMTDSPWREEWRDKTLEVQLYGGTRERAWIFWKQFDRSETRPGRDALEVYFLCTMLGFRGDMGEKLDELRRRITAIQPQIAQSQGKDLELPEGQPPLTNVPPRRGRERFQKVLLLCAIVWFIGIFLAVSLFVGGYAR